MEKIKKKTAKITVIGLGYIGLPTATLFASAGFKVFGYDISEEIVNNLKQGKIHIEEPDLKELFEQVLSKGNLIPTNKVNESDVYIICVPTPFKKEENEKKADLSYIKEASSIISKVLKKGDLVILESTVPPKTTEIFMNEILEKETGLKVNKDYYIAHCPERVLPGQIIKELKDNDRIIGVSNKKAAEMTKELYSSVVDIKKIFITNTVTAEMCKLVENTFRDINIAFANELSMICDTLNIDVKELIQLANKHPRVNILKPGVGVGGHCLAVDPWFIVEKTPQLSKLIRTARDVNDYKTQWVVEKAEEQIKNNFGDEKIIIGILGLSYKPNIGDLRESPSLRMAKLFEAKGYTVIACEPYYSKDNVGNIKNLSFKEVLSKSNYLIIAQKHSAFLSHKFENPKNIMDLTGLLNER